MYDVLKDIGKPSTYDLQRPERGSSMKSCAQTTAFSVFSQKGGNQGSGGYLAERLTESLPSHLRELVVFFSVGAVEKGRRERYQKTLGFFEAKNYLEP